jgi:hypothetical protein
VIPELLRAGVGSESFKGDFGPGVVLALFSFANGQNALFILKIQTY